MTASVTAPRQTWRYKAEFPDGRVIDGEVVASDEAAAARQVRALGATPVRLRRAGATGSILTRRSTLKPVETVSLVRGLADLLCAGVPLRTALQSLAARERRPVAKAMLERLDQRVRAGEALSEALQADPARPPAVLVALAEAGEASGELGPVLGDLAERLETEHALREDIKGQLAYPAFVAAITVITLLGLAHFVLPQFDALFVGQATPPPPETAFVLQLGAFLRAWGHWMPVGVVLLVLIIKAAAKPFMVELERAALSIPVAGATYMRLQAARYCRTLGQLLKAGYALARAEPVARGVLTSQLARRRLAEVAESVRAGGRFGDAVRRHSALPDEFISLIEVGEQTGELPDMLIRSAGLADADAARTIKKASELISPMLIVLLALCVLAVIVSILIGVLSLNEVVYS
ncbi:type II secretion system F family protein [Maricaulaceae bacterium EIL42A08]|nr:type II secretion system F family protein [Maricaulaceae bacterium EIL42A08]